MSGMEHAIERAAQVIWAAIERQADIVADGMHLDVQGVLTPHWIAEALATNGLLAPAPLREDGVGWYEVIHPSRATTHIAYVHEDGSIYFPEGTQVLDTHEFAFAAARGRAYRLVRADAVNRAEGDGRAVTHE